LRSLSEQQLVDCDRKIDQGCNGGLMDNAFDYVAKNGGLCQESDYPYVGAGNGKEKCSASTCKSLSGTGVTKHTDVAKDEMSLMSALSQQPVSVAIEADQGGFQFYSSGVFSGSCGTKLDHGVLAVGYGTTTKTKTTSNDGKKYWKVKNSWGATWGMKGFILLERGKKEVGGQCGILNSASYPTL
jgi:KDEL-tailed cysteine endopeptidase